MSVVYQQLAGPIPSGIPVSFRNSASAITIGLHSLPEKLVLMVCVEKGSCRCLSQMSIPLFSWHSPSGIAISGVPPFAGGYHCGLARKQSGRKNAIFGFIVSLYYFTKLFHFSASVSSSV